MRAIVNDILRTAPGTLVLTAKLESGHIETGDKLFLMPEANPVTVKGWFQKKNQFKNNSFEIQQFPLMSHLQCAAVQLRPLQFPVWLPNRPINSR